MWNSALSHYALALDESPQYSFESAPLPLQRRRFYHCTLQSEARWVELLHTSNRCRHTADKRRNWQLTAALCQTMLNVTFAHCLVWAKAVQCEKGPIHGHGRAEGKVNADRYKDTSIAAVSRGPGLHKALQYLQHKVCSSMDISS